MHAYFRLLKRRGICEQVEDALREGGADRTAGAPEEGLRSNAQDALGKISAGVKAFRRSLPAMRKTNPATAKAVESYLSQIDEAAAELEGEVLDFE